MIDAAWAQAGGAASPPALVSFLPLILVFVVFYFLLIRPQQQKTKEHRIMLSNLKRNDRVITSGGLHGTVTELGDDVVTIEVAPKVRVRVSRPMITTVLTVQKIEDKGKSKETK